MTTADGHTGRLSIEVVHGGSPDAATSAAIEQAVRSVLSATRAAGASEAPAWRRAARLEGTTPVRIRSRAGLSEARASGR